MTRFARAKRDTRMKEHNPTDWKELKNKNNQKDQPKKTEKAPEEKEISSSGKMVLPDWIKVGLGKMEEHKEELIKSENKKKVKKSRKKSVDSINFGDATTSTPAVSRKLPVEAEIEQEKALEGGKIEKKAKKTRKRKISSETPLEIEQNEVKTAKRKKKKAENEDSEEKTTEKQPEILPKSGQKKKKLRKHKVPAQNGIEKQKSDNDNSKSVKEGPKFTVSDKEIDRLHSLDEVRKLAQSYVAEGKLGKKDIEIVVKKWERREDRKLKRREEWHTSKVCFNCRQVGHMVADCPEQKKNIEFGVGICFKCGSTEHNIYKCSAKVKGFPFANCFICKEQGHLSRDCKKNKKGIYPDGGDCKLCGERDHLKRDCPLLKPKPTTEEMTLSTVGANTGADDDETEKLEKPAPKVQQKRKKAKLVKI